jgi:hypothetical protein
MLYDEDSSLQFGRRIPDPQRLRHLQNLVRLRFQVLQGQMLCHAMHRQKVLRQMLRHGMRDEVQNILG